MVRLRWRPQLQSARGFSLRMISHVERLRRLAPCSCDNVSGHRHAAPDLHTTVGHVTADMAMNGHLPGLRAVQITSWSSPGPTSNRVLIASSLWPSWPAWSPAAPMRPSAVARACNSAKGYVYRFRLHEPGRPRPATSAHTTTSRRTMRRSRAPTTTTAQTGGK